MTVFLCLLSASVTSADTITLLRENGEQIEGSKIDDWHRANGRPRLNGKTIFEDDKPPRWILYERDQNPTAPRLTAYIEYLGGDRYPGSVVRFVGERTAGYHPTPEHFEVQSLISFRDPESSDNRPLRLRTEWLRRVVWDDRGHPLTPGTVFLKDGSLRTYRSLRWSTGGIKLLLESGTETIPFDKLAEVHLPREDSFSALLDQWAARTVSVDDRLVRLETFGGLIATDAVSMLRPGSQGGRKEREHWYQVVQPAWSLTPLFVTYESLRMQRFFPLDRPPLTCWEPIATRHRVMFSREKKTTRDEIIPRMPRVADRRFGWSLTLVGDVEQDYRVPGWATGFVSRYGLDESVGDGGYLRAEVQLDGNSRYRSEPLSGSKPPQSTGELDWGSGTETERTLTLKADALATETPPGRDPFDIRDVLHWGEPIVKLDRDRLAEELRSRRRTGLPSLAGWESIAGLEREQLFEDRWWTNSSRPFDRVRLMDLGTEPIVIRRRFRVPADARWMGVGIARADDKQGEVDVLLRIDPVLGKSGADSQLAYAMEHRLHTGNNGEFGRAVPVPIENYAGSRIDVELVLLAEKEKTLITFEGVDFRPDPPGLLRLYDGDRAPEWDLGGETALEDSEKLFTGDRSMRFRGEIGMTNFPDPPAEIRTRPDLNQYKLLRFAWQTDEADVITLELGHEWEFGSGLEAPGKRPPTPRMLANREERQRRRGQNQTYRERGVMRGYRYDAGKGRPPYGDAAVRLDSRPPRDWKDNTREVHQEFGEFDLTGFRFLVPGNKEARIDRVYLARHWSDWSLLPPDARPPGDTGSQVSDRGWARSSYDRRLFPILVSPFTPGFVLRNPRGDVKVILNEPELGEHLRFALPEKNKPQARFVRMVSAPADEPERRYRLDIQTAASENHQFRLVVRLGETVVTEKEITETTEAQRWQTHSVEVAVPPGTVAPLSIEMVRNEADPLVLIKSITLTP